MGPGVQRGDAVIRSLVLLAIVGLVAGCPGPKSPVDYEDAPPTPEEAAQTKKGKTACQLAAERLKALHCKESADDFAQRCQELTDAKIPLCPLKLSRIKTCDEIEAVCR